MLYSFLSTLVDHNSVAECVMFFILAVIFAHVIFPDGSVASDQGQQMFDNDNDNDKQFIFRHVCPYNIKRDIHYVQC